MTITVKLAPPLELRRSASDGSLLELIGTDPQQAQIRVLVTLTGVLNAPLLQDPVGELTLAGTAGRYRLTTANGSWELVARDCFVHRDFSSVAAAALPPQAVRWRTRALWQLAILLARWPVTRRWLSREQR